VCDKFSSGLQEQELLQGGLKFNYFRRSGGVRWCRNRPTRVRWCRNRPTRNADRRIRVLPRRPKEARGHKFDMSFWQSSNFPCGRHIVSSIYSWSCTSSESLCFVEQYYNFLGDVSQSVGWAYHRNVYVRWGRWRDSAGASTPDVWPGLPVLILTDHSLKAFHVVFRVFPLRLCRRLE
jgi:hypothetical protein